MEYVQKGDYLFPELDEEPAQDLGKYGHLHMTFLKENKPTMYNYLMIQGELIKHCTEIQAAAQSQLDQFIEEKTKQADDIPDKTTRPLEWVGYMNSIKSMAEEIIYSELVYC